MKKNVSILIDHPKRKNRGTPNTPENTLYFWIGVEVYTVRVTKDPIFMNGVECLGIAEYRTREILLSPGLPPYARMATLLHEVRHAWQFHFPGTSSTAEDEATTTSSIMLCTWTDLESQGGEAAVIALQPQEADHNNYCDQITFKPSKVKESRPKREIRGLRIAQ